MSTEEEVFRLFEIKKKFLSIVPHPKVILKYYRDLKGKDENITSGLTFQSMELNEFLVKYSDELVQVRLQISNAQTNSELATVLGKLYTLQLSLLNKLSKLTSGMSVPSLENIKVSAPIDGYELFKFIRENEMGEKEIKEYIRAHIHSVDEADALLMAVLRAKKIISDGQSI